MQAGEPSCELRSTELRDRLAARGLQVGQPAREVHLREAEEALGVSFSDEWRQIYSVMDGAFDGGTDTWINLWPLAEIVSEGTSVDLRPGYFAFADQMICADVFAADFRDFTKPVLEKFSRKPIASSAGEFFTRLAAGEYQLQQK